MRRGLHGHAVILRVATGSRSEEVADPKDPDAAPAITERVREFSRRAGRIRRLHRENALSQHSQAQDDRGPSTP
jgi:hypothetical protein